MSPSPGLGNIVTDTWRPEWGAGTVTAVLEFRIHVTFGSTLRVYDRPHCRFLQVDRTAAEHREHLRRWAKRP